MRATTPKLKELFLLFKKSYLEPYLGLYELRKSQGEDPEKCPFVVKGENLIYEFDYEKIVELCREIVNEHDKR